MARTTNRKPGDNVRGAHAGYEAQLGRMADALRGSVGVPLEATPLSPVLV